MATQIENKSKFLGCLSEIKENEAKTLFQLSQETDIHPDTLKKMLEEFELIQDYPKLDIIRANKQILVRFKEEIDLKHIHRKLNSLERKIDALKGVRN